MLTLQKATLEEITAGANPKPVKDTKIAVQFNPASLKLDLANRVEGGDTRGRQSRQYLGKTSTTLAFDLHFDTSDRGTTDKPVSVRTLTAAIERFVLPKGQGNTKQAPPKARFHWDALKIDGIIESVSIDFDLFAANGTPLRAKLGVSIKEQDARYELLKSGAGANTAGSAKPPGVTGTGPGTAGGGATDRSAEALDGESLADFAARMGLDPSAWRGIAAQLGAASSLSLSSGMSIDFNSSLSAGSGIGVSAGVEAGSGVSLGAAFGLDKAAQSTGGASAPAGDPAGFALAAAGGVGSAIETVAIVKSDSAAADARRSFGAAVPAAAGASPAVGASAGAASIGTASISAATASAIAGRRADVPPQSVAPKPAMPAQSRAPLKQRGTSPALAAASRDEAPSAPAPPLADPRATSFGFGVPLRPRVGSAADLRASAAAGRIPLRPRSRVTDVIVAGDPAAAPWERLPAVSTRQTADRAQRRRHPAHPCGCSGRCHHGGR
jgi:hypothetical protein